MNLKIMLLLIFPIASCLAQEINVRYQDSLVLLEKDLVKCIKEHSDHELDCRKEYYHALQYYEKEVYYAVSEIRDKTNTKAQTDEFIKAEVKWKDSSYWYLAKMMKEFQKTHPGKFVWTKGPGIKDDARVFYQKNAQYFKDRINYLLSLVKS